MPVILRMTTRICHVKALVTVGERSRACRRRLQEGTAALGDDAGRRQRAHSADVRAREGAARRGRGLSAQYRRDRARTGASASSPPARPTCTCANPSPMRRCSSSASRCPVPFEKIRAFAATVDQAGRGRGSRAADRDRTQGQRHRMSRQGHPAAPGRTGAERAETRRSPSCSASRLPAPNAGVHAARRCFRGRRPCASPARTSASITRCRSCKNITISGDIGCYTLGAGHPWNALDTTISMGASMGIAHGPRQGPRRSRQGQAHRRRDRRLDLPAHGHAGPARHRLQPAATSPCCCSTTARSA